MRIKRYVINLDRRPDRWSDFLSRYGRGDVERFSAVDGLARLSSLDELSEFEKRLLSFGGWKAARGAGVFGCWMSHVKLWDLLCVSDEDAFVVFEDDAFFVSDFHEKLDFILERITPEMDIVYFGGRSPKNFKPSDFNREWVAYKDFYAPRTLKFGHNMDRTTHGYVVTRGGAENIMKKFYDWNRIPIPAVDGFLNSIRKDIVSLDFFPHIASSPVNYKSDVQRR
ncbi:MAG: glycosyltransferase family 25 protein [Flavobacteriaceae bacterium]